MQKVIAILVYLIGAVCWSQEIKPEAEKLHESGLTAMREGNLQEALTCFNRVLADHPGFAEAYASRAMLKERLNDTHGALRDYTLSLELKPDKYEVLFSRAILRYQAGQYVLAQEDFLKLLTMPVGETNSIYYRRSAHSPGTDRILTAQGSMKSQLFNYLGLIQLELNNCLQAIAYLDSAILLQISDADYYVNRALAKLDCNQNDALDDLKNALALDPDHPMAKHNLAMVAAKQGSYDVALMELTEIISSDPMMVEPYLERGYYRLLQRDYKGALADYSQALALDSSDPDTWLNRGMVNEKLKDWKNAHSDYTHAIELKPDFAEAWLNRGNLSASRFNFIDAIEDYSVAIVYKPNYPAAFFNQALAYYRIGKSKEACLDLKKAISHGMEIEKSVMEVICKKG